MDLANNDNYPRYRLRLFLSVDLAGSTAFKANEGRRPAGSGQSQPLWVQTTREFYREFPKLVEQHHSNLEKPETKDGYPRPWKTVGDEILFCCRLLDLDHLASCMLSFLRALSDYGLTLEKQGRFLDVKGTAWVAAFPSPNVTVALGDVQLAADQFDEQFEANADRNPKSVDFLGNGIDCGFRVASRSASDRCALSIELAWLLAEASSRGKLKGVTFNYHDRHILKGVLRDRPYPVFSLDTERNYSRIQMREREHRITGQQPARAVDICDFLKQFMLEEGIELPSLPWGGGGNSAEIPSSYEEFKEAWLTDAEAIRLQKVQELEAEEAQVTEESKIPDSVSASVSEILNRWATSKAEGKSPGFEEMIKVVSHMTVKKPTEPK